MYDMATTTWQPGDRVLLSGKLLTGRDAAHKWLIEGQRDEHHFVHHLTAAEAGAIARDGGVGMLILTHLPPSLDVERSRAEAAKAFGGEVAVASPGDVYEI